MTPQFFSLGKKSTRTEIKRFVEELANRAKITWRRTLMKELEEMGVTSGEAQARPRHRTEPSGGF